MSTLKVTRIERLNNSKDGNPRARIHTPDGALVTAPDSQAGLQALNCEGHPGVRVRLEISERGVTRVEILTESE